MRLGYPGFGGTSVFLQPGKAEEVRDASRHESLGCRFRGLAGSSEASPEHLFIQPEILGVAFGSLLTPTTLQTSGRVPWHTLASLADFPSVLHPEGLRFLGVLL